MARGVGECRLMHLVGLPGRNSETEAWMENLLGSLRLGQTRSTSALYAHWESGSSPDVNAESERWPIGDAGLVVAKSLGTMVLLAAVERGAVPGRAVLIGTPLGGYSNEQKVSLRSLTEAVPCLFIQQTNDFTGSFAELRATVGESGARMVEVSGDDHIYADVAELVRAIEDWWPEVGDG